MVLGHLQDLVKRVLRLLDLESVAALPVGRRPTKHPSLLLQSRLTVKKDEERVILICKTLLVI